MRRALLAVALLAGCGAEEQGGARTDAIVGGAPDSLDKDVFLLDGRGLGLRFFSMCTGTLIAPRTIVTAAHCVDPALLFTPVTWFVGNATNGRQASAGQFIEVQSMRMHPAYSSLQAAAGNDLALLLLKSSPPGVAPRAWNRADLAPFVGSLLRVVGYGRKDPDDYDSWGTRDAVVRSLKSVDAHHLRIDDAEPRGICNGDSGGPSMLLFPDGVERIVGVHSFTDTDACAGGVDVRLDKQQTFIDQWMRDFEAPVVPPADPVPCVDCPGVLGSAPAPIVGEPAPPMAVGETESLPECGAGCESPAGAPPVDSDTVKLRPERCGCSTQPSGTALVVLGLLAARRWRGGSKRRRW